MNISHPDDNRSHPAGTAAHNGTASVFIVDDHPLVIEGLSALIRESEGLAVCGNARSSEDAMQQLRTLHPAVILVDLSMDGGGGLELIRRIHSRYPNVRVLVVSMYEEATYGMLAMRAGAMGYVNKRESADEIIAAIRSLLAGISRFRRRQPDSLSTLETLSAREMEVFELIARGETTNSIAATMKRSVKTVETHREHIKEKLNLPSSHALTVFAVQWRQNQGSPAGDPSDSAQR